jgi:thymidylate kinase
LTVALVGLDGAGKTTVARRLPRMLDRPTAYVYMGVNAESSNRMLPTTRLIEFIKRRRRSARGRAGAALSPLGGHAASADRGQAASTAGGRSDAAPDAAAASARHTGSRPPASESNWPRVLGPAIGGVRLVNRIAEEIYRQRIAASHRGRGEVVILDRDFLFDYYATDVVDRGHRTLGRRIHGLFLRKIYPRPDLLLLLDAPPDVLFARKGEGTIETLTRRRADYQAALALVPRHAVIDATRSLDEVTAEAARMIKATLSDPAGGTAAVGGGER